MADLAEHDGAPTLFHGHSSMTSARQLSRIAQFTETIHRHRRFHAHRTVSTLDQLFSQTTPRIKIRGAHLLSEGFRSLSESQAA